MIVDKQGVLKALIENQPALLRPLIRSACSIPELEELYVHSSTQHPCCRSEAILNHLRINIDIRASDLAKIPVSGPLVVVANHPFGLLDGLILHYILERVRRDIKILANSAICALDGFVDNLIPIDVFARRACTRNILAAREALRWLSSGHGIATFPSGIVSHWNRNERRIADPEWQDFAVRCALAARAAVVPVYFEGRNSLALAPFVSPRRAFRQHLLQKHEMRSIVRCLREVDDLPIHDLGPLEGVPVLLRQYLRLGGKVAGFNVDSRFSGVLDALLIVDLRQTPRKLLARYMGATMCEEFLRMHRVSGPILNE